MMRHRSRARRNTAKVLAAVVILAAGTAWGIRGGPPRAAAAGAPKAYVGLYGDDAIGVLDTASGRILRTIKVADGPEAVIVAQGGKRVYVSSEDATTISVIDTATDRVVKTLDVGAFPEGMS